MIPSKNLLNRLKETPHIRIAYVAMIASILLVASLAVMNPMNAAGSDDDGGKIHAKGTFGPAVTLPAIQNLTAPAPDTDLRIITQIMISHFHGSLEGRATSLTTRTQELVVEKKTFWQYTSTFWGTLEGKKGSFSYHAHAVVDNSTPPPAKFHATFSVIEGSGQGELEGICGSGSWTNEGGPPARYDFTFRFGKDCKAND